MSIEEFKVRKPQAGKNPGRKAAPQDVVGRLLQERTPMTLINSRKLLKTE